MFKAKITDDKSVISEYVFDNYNLSTVDDGLTLELLVNGKPGLRYQIMSDTREPEFDRIKNFITNQLEKAASGEHPFVLSEYLIRAYIDIGSDDERRQFTAHKL